MLGINLVGVVRHCGCAPPADCKTVCVAHVDILDVGCALSNDLHGRRDESLEAFVELAAAESHRHAVREIEFPGSTRVVAQRCDARAGFGHTALPREVVLRDFRLRAVGAGELRKLERHTEANLDFRKAAELTRNEREKAYLLGRAAEVAA